MAAPNASLLAPHRWLITGGCGFIGRNLVKNLIDEGSHYIRIVDNLSASTREDLAQVCTFTQRFSDNLRSQSSDRASHRPPDASAACVELIVADILDADVALTVAEDMDVIVHLAANTGVGPSVEDPRSDCDNNVIGTINYLEAARQKNVKKFIFASVCANGYSLGGRGSVSISVSVVSRCSRICS